MGEGRGKPSEKILGVATSHAIIARNLALTNVDSPELGQSGATKADVRASSPRRFQAMVNETRLLAYAALRGMVIGEDTLTLGTWQGRSPSWSGR